MNTFQTVPAQVAQALQEVLTSLLSTKAKTMAQTTLRLGVFMLLVLPVAQCRAAESTPQAGVKKHDTAATVGAPQGSVTKAESSDTSATKATPTPPLENALARLDAVDTDYSTISLRDCVLNQPDSKLVCNGKAFHVKVNDLGLRAKLKQFHVGDYLRVDINEQRELQDLRGPWSAPKGGISPTNRLLVLAACALVILGLATAVTKGAPLKFIVGMDNRYSNSKFQIALWFWVVMSTYIATVVFRVWYAGWDFFGGVNIPQNLLVLSGLSALTYGGAKAITTAKANAAANPVPVVGAAPAAPNPPNPAAVAPPVAPNPGKTALQPGQERFFRDLVQNDVGGFDFGDFQMLVITFVAVVMYLMLIFNFLGSIEFTKPVSLPDVDTTILAGFGLGQGAYLAKKAAGNAGTS